MAKNGYNIQCDMAMMKKENKIAVGDDIGFNVPIVPELTAAASVVLTKLSPQFEFICSAAARYVLEMSALRFDVADWYMAMVCWVHEPHDGAAVTGSDELKGR